MGRRLLLGSLNLRRQREEVDQEQSGELEKFFGLIQLKVINLVVSIVAFEPKMIRPFTKIFRYSPCISEGSDPGCQETFNSRVENL